MALTSIMDSLRGAVRRLLGGQSEPEARGRPTPKAVSPTGSIPPPPRRVPSAASTTSRAAPALRVTRTVAPGVSTHASSVSGLIWMGLGQTIKYGDFEIRDPLVYFFDGQSESHNEEPAAVDRRLPVSRIANPSAAGELPYWPRYDQLASEQRRVYLEWLARGRASVPPELGYAFIYLYGLERRALVDRQDIKPIFKEVLRLREVYAKSGRAISRSFETYSSSFLWLLLLRESAVFAMRHFEALGRSTHAWDEDRLALALSWLATDGQPLPEWLAFVVAERLPKSQRSVVVKRVRNEMQELFSKRYREQFGNGMMLKASKRERKYSYRPASAALPPFEVVGSNPMGVSSQFNVLSELWNECIVDLKKLSSVMASSTREQMTVETWNALPPELQADEDHPLADQFTRFIDEHTADTHTIAPARSLATVSGIPVEAKLTAAACRRIGAVVEDVGYCVEPDPRLTGRSYEAEESVIVFLNLADGTTTTPRYAAASMLLSVGFALAQIDGHCDEGELSVLTQHIDSAFDLNEHEERRLSMLRALLIAKGADLSDVTKPLKRLPQTEREQVAKFALALVAADGVVTKDEQKAVRQLYAAMGFERDQADAAIAALTTKPASDDQPVTVLQAEKTTPGEAIPPRPEATRGGGLKLDRAAIAAILKDTAEVSRMLADAMNVDAQQVTREPIVPLPSTTPSQPPQEPANSGGDVVDPSVPARYAAFYQVIVTRPQWSHAELLVLAKQNGLMLAGAIEAINEWSTDKHGGPLLYEDGQQFTLESAYMN